MSQATMRHENAQPLKSEVMKEIKYWTEATGYCLKELNADLNSLKLSRDVAKREIHSARALLEEHLREMEERALDKLQTLVQGEMKLLKDYMRKLQTHQKRLANVATTLGDKVVGVRLTRTLQDGKDQIVAAQESLVAVRKQNLASRVGFDLNGHLVPIVNGECTLGTTILKPMTGERKYNPTLTSTGDTFLTKQIDDHQDVKEQLVNERPTVMPTEHKNWRASQPPKRNPDYMSELEKLEQELTATLQKSRLQTQKVLQTEKTASTFSSDTEQVAAPSTTTIKVATRVTDPLSGFNRSGATSTKHVQRPHSLRPSTFGNRDQFTLHVRISKSARDDTRLAPNVVRPIAKNAISYPYSHYDEQGPDVGMFHEECRTKEKPSVRYLGYDFIKEITSVDGDTDETLKDDAQLLMTFQDQTALVPRTSGSSRNSTRSTTNASISSVSYKPSSKNASGPVHLPARHPSKSYFTYSSRFHTKKHPDDTDLCRLAGIVALESGQVVVTDINHLQVMLFAPDFTYLFAVECPSPCGICVVASNILAVTLFHNRKLLLLRVHSIHMEKVREIHINCPETLYDVTFKNEQYYVLCFGGGIHVLGNDGKQVRVINTCISGGVARHLKVSDDGRYIYVTGPDYLVCFSEYGETVWQYRPGRRQFTPGDVILHHGRLFVTNWRAHTVIELSLEGTHVRDVVIDNVEYPQSMAIHAPSEKLFVAQSQMFKQEAQTRKIRVFDIK